MSLKGAFKTFFHRGPKATPPELVNSKLAISWMFFKDYGIQWTFFEALILSMKGIPLKASQCPILRLFSAITRSTLLSQSSIFAISSRGL